MSMNVNQDYSQFYVGTEQLKSYGSNSAVKKDTIVQVNSTGTTEMFTGAYNKRVQQNRQKAAAEASHAKQEEEPKQAAGDVLGATVTFSKESQEFMEGVAERKAAQAAAKAEVDAQYSGNAFAGTGDFKQQYLVFSENLYNNGFYDDMSDDEVMQVEGLLRSITSGMDSINGVAANPITTMSHEAAKLELTSSVSALNYFAEKYVPEEMQEAFKDLIKQYESYNNAKVATHKNIYDMRDESMSKIAAPNAVNVSELVKKTQEDTKASQEIGRVTHTEEEESQNKSDYQALFEKLIRKEDSISGIFDSLQSTLVNFASGGSNNSSIIAMLNSRNLASINHMMSYWSKLL